MNDEGSNVTCNKAPPLIELRGRRDWERLRNGGHTIIMGPKRARRTDPRRIEEAFNDIAVTTLGWDDDNLVRLRMRGVLVTFSGLKDPENGDDPLFFIKPAPDGWLQLADARGSLEARYLHLPSLSEPLQKCRGLGVALRPQTLNRDRGLETRPLFGTYRLGIDEESAQLFDPDRFYVRFDFLASGHGP
jgi:hypothetical protein